MLSRATSGAPCANRRFCSGCCYSPIQPKAGFDIEIATGTISGREALVQMLILPTTLAAGMVVIGLIFAAGL